MPEGSFVAGGVDDGHLATVLPRRQLFEANGEAEGYLFDSRAGDRGDSDRLGFKDLCLLIVEGDIRN